MLKEAVYDEKNTGFGDKHTEVLILALLFTSCVTLKKLLNPSESLTSLFLEWG